MCQKYRFLSLLAYRILDSLYISTSGGYQEDSRYLRSLHLLGGLPGDLAQVPEQCHNQCARGRSEADVGAGLNSRDAALARAL